MTKYELRGELILIYVCLAFAGLHLVALSFAIVPPSQLIGFIWLAICGVAVYGALRTARERRNDAGHGGL